MTTLPLPIASVNDLSWYAHVLMNASDGFTLDKSLQVSSAENPSCALLNIVARHLVLDLKTGAFLQLILTLIAITSRMSMLLSEIGSALEQAWTSCYRLHSVLDVCQKLSVYIWCLTLAKAFLEFFPKGGPWSFQDDTPRTAAAGYLCATDNIRRP